MSNEIAVEKIVDCKGMACPQPVILTKRSLEEGPALLTVVVDNAAEKVLQQAKQQLDQKEVAYQGLYAADFPGRIFERI